MGEDVQIVERTTPITELGRDHVWTDEEKVEYLLHRSWSVSRILRKTGLSRRSVLAIIDRIDEAKIAEISGSHEAIKSRHAAYLEEVAAEVFEAHERSGNVNPRVLRVGMEALAQVRRIYGLDAAEKSVSVNVDARLMDREQTEAMVHDPTLRALYLEIENRQRELEASHVAGTVRRAGERRVVALQTPSPADEPAGADDRGGRDRAAHDAGAAPDREIRVLGEVVPGVVPGDVPGSEGHPG